MTAPAISPAEKLAGAAQDLLACLDEGALTHAAEDALDHLRAALAGLPGREVLAARGRVVDEAVDGRNFCDFLPLDNAISALLRAERAESTSYAVERQDRLRAASMLTGKAGA